MRRTAPLFCIASIVLFAVYAAAPLREYFREWKGYQKHYNQLAQERLRQNIPVRLASIGIRQIWQPELDAVDRCETCHLGIDNQALRDALTGLYNRHFLEEALDRMCLDAERRKTSIAAIMIDIDHFKRLNDQHGHAAGDAALQEIASTILSCVHRTDMACRYGGEELAILLPDCSLAAAAEKAEEIRGRIADLRTHEGLSVTASLGVAAIPETTIRAGDLLSSADAALYQAKQEGRNRVVLATARSTRQRLNLVETAS